MLMHAEWGGRGVIEGAMVLDVFAGTGALGLEALSRGAASACFIENDAAALKALRANVAACGAEGRVEIVAGDALTIPPLFTASAHRRCATCGAERGEVDNQRRGGWRWPRVARVPGPAIWPGPHPAGNRALAGGRTYRTGRVDRRRGRPG